MPLLIEDITDEINTYLSEIYEEDSNTKVLYNDNGEIKIIKVGNEETAVNKCCETLFTKTPEINNELVNREVIGTTQTKRLELISLMPFFLIMIQRSIIRVLVRKQRFIELCLQ